MLAREVTRSASSSSASSARTSAAWRACRGSAAIAGREILDQPLESQPVALRAEPGHDADGQVSEQRVTPLWLAGEDVRQVHLNERDPDGEQRVAEREARVREGRGVDDGPVGSPPEPLDRFDQL